MKTNQSNLTALAKIAIFGTDKPEHTIIDLTHEELSTLHHLSHIHTDHQLNMVQYYIDLHNTIKQQEKLIEKYRSMINEDLRKEGCSGVEWYEDTESDIPF
jgi:hypothetical protein